MPTFTAQMASLKNWRGICRIAVKNGSHAAGERRVALFSRLIGQSMNDQTKLKHVRRLANGKAI